MYVDGLLATSAKDKPELEENGDFAINKHFYLFADDVDNTPKYCQRVDLRVSIVELYAGVWVNG